MYQDSTNGNTLLTITTTGDIITFLTDTLAAILGSESNLQQKIRARQYYIQNYTRYNVNAQSGDGTVYWEEQTVDANSLTGYFYNINGSDNTPIPVGTYSTHNMKYATKGAMIKFVAPSGYYFNVSNRLVAGIASPSDKTYIWTTVLNVIGDGYNNGEGAFSNGTGPITLNGYVPQGAIVSTILPAFDNSLPNIVIQECVVRMELNQSFSLIFDNSLTIAQDRWSIGAYNASNYFVNFLSSGNNRYSISYRSLTYYFGSVADTRFTFESSKLVYDPFSGKILQDFVKVLATNTQFNSNYALAAPVSTSIIGQTVESDGYINDFEVEIASIDVNDRTLVSNPDFFTEVTGYVTGNTNIGVYTFFELIQDAINLSRYQLIDSSTVVYQYPNKTQIEVVKYEYPEGQLFYAYSDNVFYRTIQDQTVNTLYYVVTEQPQYIMKPGRQGLQFQYRHNSNNTTRIDPATTNIIDLYLVTQSYYTAYQNWLQDITDTVPMPDKPTINELSQSYGSLNDYKMLSDSVILNSVVFLPLFGPKAPELLRATVKVIRATNTNASDSEIRSAVLSAMNAYFDINNWNFGDTFYFSELSAYLHAQVGELISSAVLVPNDPTMNFGDLYEIKSAPYEIFANGATANDVVVIAALTPAQLQIR
jgi:hypothetical protein